MKTRFCHLNKDFKIIDSFLIELRVAYIKKNILTREKTIRWWVDTNPIRAAKIRVLLVKQKHIEIRRITIRNKDCRYTDPSLLLVALFCRLFSLLCNRT